MIDSDNYPGIKMNATSIAIFLFDGITALDAVGPYEVLAKIPQAEVSFVACRPGAVQSMGGLRLIAERSIDEDFIYDIIIIPGGEGIKQILGNEKILNWIRIMHRQTKYTGITGRSDDGTNYSVGAGV